jgi:hypothetical protein
MTLLFQRMREDGWRSARTILPRGINPLFHGTPFPNAIIGSGVIPRQGFIAGMPVVDESTTATASPEWQNIACYDS